VLAAASRSVADSLKQLADCRDQFQREYRAMLNTFPLKGLPAAVCTIYGPRYPDPVQRRVGTAALCISNDCIIRQARYHCVPISICMSCAAKTPISPTRSSLPFRAAAG